MEDHHHHHLHAHHHPVVSASINRIFIFCIILNLLFVLVEAVVGFFYNSVGLLSDAGHNLSDVFSLLLALLAIRMTRIHANRRFTYGYKKSTILVSLLNAVILLVAVGAIVIESIHNLNSPVPVSGKAITWTAAIGILINGLTTWLLMRDSKHDINVKGAFLHMMMDTLVSVGVVISGIIITYTGYVWIDSVISLSIAVIILVSTFNLLRESLSLSLDGVPTSVNLTDLEKEIGELDGVMSWHHLHVWAISTTENAATIHVVIEDLNRLEDIKKRLKHLFSRYEVSHCTVEIETADSVCEDQCCM